MKPLIVDALASGKGSRLVTRDVIGAGPRTIAGIIESEGFETKIVTSDFFLNSTFDCSNYNSLLISGMSSDIKSVRKIINKWKTKNSGPVIAGGPVTSQFESAFRKLDVDIGVIGEGEEPFLELIKNGLFTKGIPSKEILSHIRGIVYKDIEMVINDLRPVMKREKFDNFRASINVIQDYELYKSSRVYVEVVRGCSNYHRTRLTNNICIECDKCIEGELENRYYCPSGIAPGCGYCSVPSLFGPSKSRSVDNIIREVDGLLNVGVSRIVLSAPGFLDYGRDLLVEPQPLTDPRHPEPNYDKIEELLLGLSGLQKIQTGRASLLLENVKGNLVTVKAARILGKYLRNATVNIGFETGSNKHSKELGRPSTPKENLEAVRRLSQEGLKPYVYFIHGLPGQTRKTTFATIDMIEKVVEAGAARIILYRFTPLPMSSFQDFPMPPPAVKNKLSRLIKEAAERANLKLKETLLGKKLRVVIAQQYNRDKKFMISYPLYHGPVVVVTGLFNEGDIVDVEITKIISDRMVQGRATGVIF